MFWAWRTTSCAVIGVNGPAVVKGQPPEVSRMDEKHAPNRATEKPVEESFSSPGVEWNINGKTRKPRNPNKGKVRLSPLVPTSNSWTFLSVFLSAREHQQGIFSLRRTFILLAFSMTCISDPSLSAVFKIWLYTILDLDSWNGQFDPPEAHSNTSLKSK